MRKMLVLTSKQKIRKDKMTINNNEKLIVTGKAQGELDVTVTRCCTWGCNSSQEKRKESIIGPILNDSFSIKINERKAEENIPEQIKKEVMNLKYNSKKSLLDESDSNVSFLETEILQHEYQIRLNELHNLNFEGYTSLLEKRAEILEKDVPLEKFRDILDLYIHGPVSYTGWSRVPQKDLFSTSEIYALHLEKISKQIEDIEKKKMYENQKVSTLKKFLKKSKKEGLDKEIALETSTLWEKYCRNEENKIRKEKYFCGLSEGHEKIRLLLDKKYDFNEEEKEEIKKVTEKKVDALNEMVEIAKNLKFSEVIMGYKFEKDQDTSQYSISEFLWSSNEMNEWQKKEENKSKKLERTNNIVEYLPKTATRRDALVKCCEYGADLVYKLLSACNVEPNIIEIARTKNLEAITQLNNWNGGEEDGK